ncbi:unnamed protein product [Adineta steineri]|uniref:Nuclear receptor domain-containing protein n=2 Tax=Adineta steineri TaxID=433720 RepID=A0A819DKX1_9BILA|nr:unnamed protein product [Adineta steineri]CAF3839513.1 unnamed protein product [Adineta steineri]
MYNEQYNSSTTFDNDRLNQSTTFRLNDSYYLDSLPYSSYNTNSYPSSSNVYFSSHQYHPFPSSSSSSGTTQFTNTDIPSYTNYDTTYLNVAVAAAAYQNGYQTHYHNNNNNTMGDPFNIGFSRHINDLYGNNEQQIETDLLERKVSTSTVETNRKRKLQDETMRLQYESELCRVCDDTSSGYHFGVFTCEACKGFFRRYSKKSTILEPCPIRCNINKNNRNNCAACRFDKCKYVGMALDKIRFGKPPKHFRSSFETTSVKLEPNNNDFQLMLKLLECYQSFEEYEQQQSTTNTHPSIIFQFCHRLADIVMYENECVPETFLARLKRHESAIKFLITGENEQNLSSWSKEPQAWIFAHNERWRLIMILLILAFDDEQIGGGSLIFLPLGTDENFIHSTNNTVIERILRLFELECDQEKEARTLTETSNSYTNLTNEKNIKYMKAQFVLRFVDMMANDMISNRVYSTATTNSYSISENNYQNNNNEVVYLSSDSRIEIQQTELNQSNDNCSGNF